MSSLYWAFVSFKLSVIPRVITVNAKEQRRIIPSRKLFLFVPFIRCIAKKNQLIFHIPTPLSATFYIDYNKKSLQFSLISPYDFVRFCTIKHWKTYKKTSAFPLNILHGNTSMMGFYNILCHIKSYTISCFS